MKYLEYFSKYYQNSTISLKTSWKMMKFNTQHEYPNLLRTWAWRGFSHVEQIPKAFFVSKVLLHISLSSILLLLIKGKSITGKFPDNFRRWLLWFELIFANFFHFLRKKITLFTKFSIGAIASAELPDSWTKSPIGVQKVQNISKKT